MKADTGKKESKMSHDARIAGDAYNGYPGVPLSRVMQMTFPANIEPRRPKIEEWDHHGRTA
jgi:hypothetical protein